MQRKLLGIISVHFDTTGKLLIIQSAFIKYLRKNGNTVKHCISYVYSSWKPIIQLGGRSYIIFSLSWYPHETGKANKNVWMKPIVESKHLSDVFPIRNGLKQGDALSPLLFNFALQYAITRVQGNQDGLKINCTHQLLAYVGRKRTYYKEKHTIFSSC